MSGLTPPTYSYGINDVTGVVAANNYISFFNPVGSGKIMLAIQNITTAYSVGLSDSAASLTVHAISAASAGTLVTASTVYRLRSDWSDPSVQIRTGNPTVTNSFPHTVFTVSPPVSSGAGGGSSGTVTTPSAGGVPYLPGEGLVWGTTSGNTNQRWNILFIWAEVDI